MAKFDRQELATSFYSHGRECVKSADILFQDKERGHRSEYGILLIHGIELLLKSYLLLKNTNLSDDSEEMDRYLKSLGHKYMHIYNECLKYGIELKNPYLAGFLNGLGNLYYADSIGVRYIQESGLVVFPTDIFGILRTELISPLHQLLFPGSSPTESYM